MKKICFVLTAEFAVKAFLLNHLRALSNTYNVTLIVNTANLGFLKDLGVNVHLVSMPIARDISLISDLSCLIKLIKIFRQQKFSAVHSVTPKAGLLAMLAAWLVNVPVRIHTFTGQVWVTKAGAKRLILKQLDKLIGKLSTQNIVDSPSQRQFLLDEVVLAEQKSCVFGHGSISGVDLNRFKENTSAKINIRQQLGINLDALVFLFLGRLTLDKGVLDLANAFNEVSDAHLLFVGPDEQNMRQQIELLTVLQKQNVHFVGHTSVPEDYMAAADVLCLPSYREGFGSVIIEAAAVGIPAIASRIYGVTDAVVENETGLLHAPNDVAGIKNCMYMMCDSAFRLKFGTRARARAIECFDSQIITNAWVDFYQIRLG